MIPKLYLDVVITTRVPIMWGGERFLVQDPFQIPQSSLDCTGCSTMSVNKDKPTSAAAKTVVSPGLSYIGATSTTSAPMTFSPVRPSSIVRSSRLVQPPGSAVPVANVAALSEWEGNRSGYLTVAEHQVETG